MTRIYRGTVIVIAVAAVGVGAFFVGRVTAPTSASVPTACQASQLHVDESGTAGAAGTIERTFSLVNTGSTTCTLHGYPGMLLLGPGTSTQPTTVTHGGGLPFENVGPSTVMLEAGAAAYFNVGYSDVMPPCSTATAVAVTPPASSGHVVVSVSPTMMVCDGGKLHVSAVFGSTDATATKTTAPS